MSVATLSLVLCVSEDRKREGCGCIIVYTYLLSMPTGYSDPHVPLDLLVMAELHSLNSGEVKCSCDM